MLRDCNRMNQLKRLASLLFTVDRSPNPIFQTAVLQYIGPSRATKQDKELGPKAQLLVYKPPPDTIILLDPKPSKAYPFHLNDNFGMFGQAGRGRGE